jgi:hypothetical protein
MVKVFLIRVGMDSTYGGFVSPIFPDKSYVFIPIPNKRSEGIQIDAPSSRLKTYAEVRTNSDHSLLDYLPRDKMDLNGTPLYGLPSVPVHNDPEFDMMTYGEKKEKRIWGELQTFRPGDYVVFYATFYPCSSDCKYREYSLSELQTCQQNNKEYYIFAFLKLKYPPIDRDNYRRYEEEIQNNAHYLRGDFHRHDGSFILKGTEESGWLHPIDMEAERHGSNYYMSPHMASYKLRNKDKRGLNRCYCRLSPDIIPLLEKHKI